MKRPRVAERTGRAFCACGKIDGHQGRCRGLFYRERRAWASARIARELRRQRGNRTRTAAALGVQRTYLLKLMRDYDVR